MRQRFRQGAFKKMYRIKYKKETAYKDGIFGVSNKYYIVHNNKIIESLTDEEVNKRNKLVAFL